jgi:hypothetical protein
MGFSFRTLPDRRTRRRGKRKEEKEETVRSGTSNCHEFYRRYVPASPLLETP